MAVKNHPAPPKGSPEAKDLMAQVRAHKGKPAGSYEEIASKYIQQTQAKG